MSLTDTGFTALDAADTFGARITKTLQVKVKNTAVAQVLQETVLFRRLRLGFDHAEELHFDRTRRGPDALRCAALH